MSVSCKQILVPHFPTENLLRSNLRKAIIPKMFRAYGVTAEECTGNIKIL